MAKKALLLTNLGSPDSPEVKDVRSYLNEFLMDEKVIDIPYPLRFLLVKGIISPFRAVSSAKLYKSIWTDKGSPLVYLTKELTDLVQEETGLPSYYCMRYANPTPTSVFEKIEAENPDLEELTLLPLYPHYAMSSFETGVDHVKAAYNKKSRKFTMKVVPPYFKNEDYTEVLTESIRPFIKEDFDKLVFSYHGIPERHVKKTDPTNIHCLKCENCCDVPSQAHDVCYRHQIKKTTEIVAQKLGVPQEKVMFAFQSRLGNDPWLKPYTAQTLEELPKEGIKNIVIVSPAFVSDCLETLEEIHEEGKEIFEEAGGERFVAVPCLNTRPDWISAISKIVETAV